MSQMIVETKYEEIEKVWKVFFNMKDEELFNEIIDILENSRLETWSEDPWDYETTKAVYAIQIKNIILYFVLKYDLRYVSIFFPDEIPLEKTHQIEKEVKERFNAEIVERDNYVTVFEIERKCFDELKRFAEEMGCNAELVACKVCGDAAERLLRLHNNIEYYCEKCYNSLP